MSKFEIGNKVKVNSNYVDTKNVGMVGTVVDFTGHYFSVDMGAQYNHLYTEDELDKVVGSVDCTGKDINVGDIIVYFTRSGSCLNHQKAKVERIDTKRYNKPHILVLKEDAVQKDLFTRKSWLWSFDNSVKVG